MICFMDWCLRQFGPTKNWRTPQWARGKFGALTCFAIVLQNFECGRPTLWSADIHIASPCYMKNTLRRSGWFATSHWHFTFKGGRVDASNYTFNRIAVRKTKNNVFAAQGFSYPNHTPFCTPVFRRSPFPVIEHWTKTCINVMMAIIACEEQVS